MNAQDEATKFIRSLPPTGTVAVVICMDRRLVWLAESLAKGEGIEKLDSRFKDHNDPTYRALRTVMENVDPSRIKVLSNAGANVEGLSPDISKEKDPAGIVIIGHSTCGGMKVIATGLVNGATEESNEFFAHLHGSRFAQANSGTRPSDDKDQAIARVQAAAEEMNPAVQRQAALAFTPNVLSLSVNVNNLNLHEEGHAHWLLLCNSNVGSYPNLEGTPRDNTYAVLGSRKNTALDRRIAEEVIGVEKVVDTRKQRVK